MIGTVQVNGEDGKGHRLKAREQASKSSQRGEKHTGSVLSNHTVNDGGFDAVDDVVACAGYKVAVAANLYLVLWAPEKGLSTYTILAKRKKVACWAH